MYTVQRHISHRAHNLTWSSSEQMGYNFSQPLSLLSFVYGIEITCTERKEGEKKEEKKKKGDTNLASVLLVKRVGYDYSEKGEGKHAIQQRSLFGISNIFSSLKQNQCSLCVPA